MGGQIEKDWNENISGNVFSFHTFFFPFTFDSEEKDPKKNRKHFEQMIKDQEEWYTDNWETPKLPKVDENGVCSTKEEQRLQYATYQYFHPAARRAVLGIQDSKQSIVSRYVFRPDLPIPEDNREKRGMRYLIKKGGKVYDLHVHAVKLKIYCSGVAVLIFELENYRHRNEEDVRMINQYGRRIRLPYFPAKDNDNLGDYLTADDITLQIGKGKLYVSFLEKQLVCGLSERNVPTNFIPEFILNLLDYSKEGKQLTYQENDSGFCIHPLLGDRMFVSCALCDTESTSKYCEKTNGYLHQPYRYQTSEDTAQALYRLLFLDTDFASCQNVQMTQGLLSQCLYARWIDCGTLHAVTHHSMFCLTAKYLGVVKNAVVNPYLTEYMEMLALVLAQRASIIALQKRASELAVQIEQTHRWHRKHVRISALLALQQEYVAFQNQLLLFEVTPEEQGVELYQLLQKQLYIQEENEVLEKQLHNLYEISNIRQSRGLDLIALLITIIAAVFGIGQMLLAINPNYRIVWATITIAVFIAISCCIYMRWKR